MQGCYQECMPQTTVVDTDKFTLDRKKAAYPLPQHPDQLLEALAAVLTCKLSLRAACRRYGFAARNVLWSRQHFATAPMSRTYFPFD